jgi:hypothetical protein
MAIEIINVGSSPNDGNGDPIRDAFIKCNDNFDELDTTKIGGSGTTITPRIIIKPSATASSEFSEKTLSFSRNLSMVYLVCSS